MSFLTQSHHVFFGRPLCLIPSTSHVIQRLTQSLSSFRSTCPNHLHNDNNNVPVCACRSLVVVLWTWSLSAMAVLWSLSNWLSITFQHFVTSQSSAVKPVGDFSHSLSNCFSLHGVSLLTNFVIFVLHLRLFLSQHWLYCKTRIVRVPSFYFATLATSRK